MSAIKIKRIYETAAKDEYRVLVDRLWPRGLVDIQFSRMQGALVHKAYEI